MYQVPHTNTISHPTHPGHRLSPVNAAAEYRCDGCNTIGTGHKFRCEPCDFDLHEYCATCPTTLSSFMHPHPLDLDLRNPHSTRQIQRVCQVCGDGIEGIFFTCKDCEFDLHPLCTQLPQRLRHALHLSHHLIFGSSGPGWCGACGSACDSWRYSCGTCGFDIHLECVLRNQGTDPSFNPTAAAPPPPPPQQVGWHGYGCGYRMNNFTVVFILGIGFLKRPVGIVAAIFVALIIGFLNDRIRDPCSCSH